MEQGESRTHRTLCRFLSSEVDAALTSTLGPDDWRLLAATARREGVAPLLYYALKEPGSPGAEESRCEGESSSSPHLPGVPSDVQADLRQAYYATAACNLVIYQELDRILAAFEQGSGGAGERGSRGAGEHGSRGAEGQGSTGAGESPSAPPPIRPSAHIPIILLKGAALAATLYPSIALRPFGDIDLLVREQHLAEAVVRLKALGYTRPHPDMAPGLNALAGHHVHLQGGQDIHLAVELHWTLIGGSHDWRAPSLSWFWSQTEEWALNLLGKAPAPVPGCGNRPEDRPQSRLSSVELKLEHENWSPISCQTRLAYLQPPIRDPRSEVLTLTPTAHLLYLCAHLMLQHGEARSVLRWFYDIHLLAECEGQRIAWDELVARAVDFRWAPAVHAALEGARDRFATRLPPGVLAALAEASDQQASQLVARRADPLQTRATGLVAAASTLSLRARLRLLLAIAVPSPAYVRWRYKPRPTWLWPLCYPYRWLDILCEGLSTVWRMANRK